MIIPFWAYLVGAGVIAFAIFGKEAGKRVTGAVVASLREYVKQVALPFKELVLLGAGALKDARDKYVERTQMMSVVNMWSDGVQDIWQRTAHRTPPYLTATEYASIFTTKEMMEDFKKKGWYELYNTETAGICNGLVQQVEVGNLPVVNGNDIALMNMMEKYSKTKDVDDVDIPWLNLKITQSERWNWPDALKKRNWMRMDEGFSLKGAEIAKEFLKGVEEKQATA